VCFGGFCGFYGLFDFQTDLFQASGRVSLGARLLQM